MKNVEYNNKIVQKKNSVPLCLCASVPSFTLIELLVVIVVISILTAITLPVSKYVTQRAREAQQKIYIEKIKSALEDYRAAYGEYPITPRTNNIPPYEVLNCEDVLRHYTGNSETPGVELTECAFTTNSPYMTVALVSNTVETITTESGTKYIDYCLTYPLMLKQIDEGARPFMEFKKETVAYLVYRDPLSGQFEIKRYRKTAGGNIVERTIQAIYGNPVNRYKAIDPVSQDQWKYECYDGITYTLTNNPTSGY